MVALAVLRHAASSHRNRICIYGDSKLVVSQLAGLWRCNGDNLVPFYEEGLRIVRRLQAVCNQGLFRLTHIYLEFNVDADALANVALDNYFAGQPVGVADN